MCIITLMNVSVRINSVSKNNFLSLMRSYERNFRLLRDLVDFRIITEKNIRKSFEVKPDISDKSLRLDICSISNHTAEIKFSYNFFPGYKFIEYVSLKIYFDSKQVEILGLSKFKKRQSLNNIQNFHDIRLSKWYKNYFLHLWLQNCLNKGYSFDLHSKV